MSDAPIARVLIDSPLPQLDQLFDYGVPARLAERAKPGVRVRVPLRVGGRVANGWLVELASTSEYSGRLSELDDVVSEVPVLNRDVWRLTRAVADRAAGNASDVLRVAIPPRSVRAEKAWAAAASANVANAEPPTPVPVPVSPLDAALLGGARMALHLGIGQTAAGISHWADTLARASAAVLASDRSVLLMVPDYRAQGELRAALSAVTDASRVLRVDARQSTPDRMRNHLAAMSDRAHIVLGNRSAVYSPAARLGLIAMWDDGDPLFAEPHAPGAHARDVALLRQEQSGAALLFAGHTRSTAVQRLVEVGWVEEFAERVVRPKVVVTEQQSEDPSQARIPSSAWRAVQDALALGPVLVQVGRPGHTLALRCDRCRAQATCRACGGRLHRAGASSPVCCTLCGGAAFGWRCPECEHDRFRSVGVGSSRTAEELGRAFARSRVIRSDGERPIERVGAEPALVVATRGAEPVADGGYRAVLLLDGDRMLLRESLMVAEDCLRWWSNAAALAAPGAPVYLVGVGGGLALALASWRQPAWAAEELQSRRALRFPPAVRVASVSALSAERVDRVVAAVRAAVPTADALGPSFEPDGSARSILRFDYAHGPAVAREVRAELIRAATERRRPGGPPANAVKLRARFDTPEAPE
ncbi:MAG TPA: primosomal protein N' [Candidatus Lumbricidophila sp.]|nr:primosomal protein N' [Candidatus Lumbricidophila sp.]